MPPMDNAQMMPSLGQVMGMEDPNPPAIGPDDVLIDKERLGKRPYKGWFGFIFSAGTVCTVVHFSQWFPIMRWFLFMLFCLLIIFAGLDIHKQNLTTGYIDRNYLKSIGIIYGMALFGAILAMLFIWYV